MRMVDVQDKKADRKIWIGLMQMLAALIARLFL